MLSEYMIHRHNLLDEPNLHGESEDWRDALSQAAVILRDSPDSDVLITSRLGATFRFRSLAEVCCANEWES